MIGRDALPRVHGRAEARPSQIFVKHFAICGMPPSGRGDVAVRRQGGVRAIASGKLFSNPSELSPPLRLISALAAAPA